MTTELADEIKAMRLTRLKVGLLSYVGKGPHGYRYLNNTREAFPWATDEEFYLALSALRSIGSITESVGRDGGKKVRVVNKEVVNAAR